MKLNSRAIGTDLDDSQSSVQWVDYVEADRLVDLREKGRKIFC
jgi:hypothetical protein